MKCPFCKEGDIKVLHIKASYSETRARAASNTKTIPVYHKAKEEALSDCSKCGKTQKEMNRIFREGKQVSCKDAVKRAEESGLPTKF